MRYLVMARVKPGRTDALEEAIDDRSLGAGSVAGGEYLKDMRHARRMDDGTIRWVETCFCPTPVSSASAGGGRPARWAGTRERRVPRRDSLVADSLGVRLMARRVSRD